MERWKLDKRIVYKFLGFMGVGKKRILAIVMISTALLSMWYGNLGFEIFSIFSLRFFKFVIWKEIGEEMVYSFF
jgi:hypothetical protein